jgi:hypothetical protein
MTLRQPITPTRYVLKIYNTESKADNGKDTDALLVLSSTDPTVDNSTKINDIYTINRKYYYRIEANEPISGIEVDWDDGENNSKGKANRELQVFKEPKTTAIFEHYYTKHKSFYPLIRARSDKGVFSKWYTPFHANNDYRELEETTLASGNNNASKVSIDSSTNPRIPIFKPANLPPLSVLKTDKYRVHSGIDNSSLSGMIKPWVFAYYTTTTFEPSDVLITYENGQGNISTQTITPWTDGSQGIGNVTSMGYNNGGLAAGVQQDATNTLPSGLGGTPHTILLATAPWAKVKRVLRVQLKSNLKGTADKGLDSYSDRVYIKVFDRATSISTTETENNKKGAATSETIGIVSLGNPIIELDDYMSAINIDGSESRTKASNRNISNYWFDEDKLINSGTDWLITAPNNGATQTGETFSSHTDIVQRGYVSVTGIETVGTSNTTVTAADLEDSYPNNYFNGMRLTVNSDNSWTTVASTSTGYVASTGVITTVDAVTLANGDSFTISNLSGELSDELSSSHSNGNVANRSLSYVFKYGEAILDADSRFYDDNKLIRLQVQDDATAAAGDKISKSKLEHWQPYKYNNEVARSFSTLHANDLTATGDDAGSTTLATLTFGTAVVDTTNIGKYIAVESANGTLVGVGNQALGGHTFNNNFIGGSDPIEVATESNQLGHNYEIMKIEDNGDGVDGLPTTSSYQVARGQFNTTAKGWLTDAKVWIMDDTSYNVRNIPSTEVDRSLLLFSNSSGKPAKIGSVLNNGSSNWRDCSVNNNIDNRLIFGGATHSSDGSPALTTVAIDINNQDPENFLLLVKDKKFDRIHIRMKNSLTTHASTTVKPTTGAGGDGPDIKIVAYYAAPETNGSSTYAWKPLKIIDGTTISNYEWSSLYNSGTISFDIPQDWIQTTASSMYGGSEWSDLVDRRNKYAGMGAAWHDEDANGDASATYDTWDVGSKTTGSTYDFTQAGGTVGIKGDAGTDPETELAKFENDFFYGWQLTMNTVSSVPKYITKSTKAADSEHLVNSRPAFLEANDTGGTIADEDNFVLSNVNEVSPYKDWQFDGYGILLAIICGNDVAPTNIKCQNIWTYNNSHSKSIKVVDPHHVSLNDIAIAQSISFGRQTTFRKLESRLGLADIQKLGAEGGKITFGGVDLGSVSTGHNLIKSYQQKATPVFLDITHRNNEITRFFGVLTALTEDHPTGLSTPKWSVTMELSYIIELDANGLIISDGRIPLGGKSINEPKYSL